MKRILLSALFLSAIIATGSAKKKLPVYGDRTEKVFEKTSIHFAPGKYNKEGIAPDENGVIHLVDGRIVLKKLSIPQYKRDVDINLNITLKSTGDRWDKSGSVFVIPNEAAINLIDIAAGKSSFPKQDTVKYERLAGIVAQDGYIPNLELMRFMTPFGVGYYSNDTLKRKPLFIDGWAPEVKWSQNITDLRSRIEGEFYVGVWIDSWTNEGYSIDLTLDYNELGYNEALQPKTHVEPVLNSVYYIGPQSHPDIFARKDLEINFEIPKNAKNVRMKYIVTGHGGHSGGDEFRPKENIIRIDDKEVYRFTPWRTDCASFRRFNPSTAVWRIDREEEYRDRETNEMKKRTVNEPLASSDLSRSNWCPGSDITPVEIDLKDVNHGKHKLFISVPEAAPAEGEKLNHWLMSAYLIWDVD
ncbi:MAG: PNGase F N-terminal domain-containing protein [Bacteroidales bacterium]|nr:PNGase F N-terminal domain-containing protein [Bacteroidales bacterium]